MSPPRPPPTPLSPPIHCTVSSCFMIVKPYKAVKFPPKMPVQPKTSRFFYFFYWLQFFKPHPINLIKEACKHISSLNFEFKFLKRYKPKNTPYTFLIVKKDAKKKESNASTMQKVSIKSRNLKQALKTVRNHKNNAWF